MARIFCWVAGLLWLGVAACATSQQELQLSDTESELAKPPARLKVSEFVLGPDDQLSIEVFRMPELTRKVTVMPDGNISFPLLGEVKAAGLGVTELRKSIVEGLRKFLVVEPQVTIELTSLKSRKVAVLGEVKRPGVFALQGTTSVLEILSSAGGLTRDATERNVLLVRNESGRAVVRKLNIGKAWKGTELSQNVLVQAGDVLYVPSSFIADVNRVFAHIRNIVGTLFILESAIILGPDMKDVLLGDPIGTTTPRLGPVIPVD